MSILISLAQDTDFVVINGVYATSVKPGGGPDTGAASASETAAAGAAGSLYRALRPDAGGYPGQEEADWCAQVVCVDAEVGSCRMLRLPLVMREPMLDDNAIGMLFALGLEQSPLETPGCFGPRIDAGRLASVTLAPSLGRGAKTQRRGIRTRASTTLATVCPHDCLPHCVAVHWEHRALCSLLLPPHEPLKDIDEHFWAIEVSSDAATAHVRLLISKAHCLPAAVEFFTISRELYGLVRSLETPL